MSVYFARVRGYVKIGYSKNPFNRVGTITAGSLTKPADLEYGDDIDLLGWIPGDRWTEREAHLHFAPNYVIGEWFWDDESVDTYIEDNDFGITLTDLPAAVVMMMESRPDVSRAAALAAYGKYRSQELADPNSEISMAARIFGHEPDLATRLHADAHRRRAEDRAYWRSRRAAA